MCLRGSAGCLVPYGRRKDREARQKSSVVGLGLKARGGCPLSLSTSGLGSMPSHPKFRILPCKGSG